MILNTSPEVIELASHKHHKAVGLLERAEEAIIEAMKHTKQPEALDSIRRAIVEALMLLESDIDE